MGRPKKRWLDNVKEDCKILGLTVEEADQLARAPGEVEEWCHKAA